MTWLDITIIAIIGGFGLYYFFRGFVMAIVSFISFVLAFFLARLIYPAIASLLRGTQFFDTLQERISNTLGLGASSTYISTNGLANGAYTFTQDTAQNDDLQSVLNRLNLSDFVQERITIGDTYETRYLLGAETSEEFVPAFLAGAAINVIAMITAFLVAFIAIKIVAGMLDIATRIPIIHQVNKLFGAALGVMIGLFVSWLVIAVAVWGFGTNPEGSLIAESLLEINVVARLVAMF